MLSAIMTSVVMLSVILLSVVAPGARTDDLKCRAWLICIFFFFVSAKNVCWSFGLRAQTIDMSTQAGGTGHCSVYLSYMSMVERQETPKAKYEIGPQTSNKETANQRYRKTKIDCFSHIYIGGVYHLNTGDSNKQHSPLFLPWPPWAAQHRQDFFYFLSRFLA